jgi:hypothetical protein
VVGADGSNEGRNAREGRRLAALGLRSAVALGNDARTESREGIDMSIKEKLTNFILLKPKNNARRGPATEQQVQLNIHTCRW